MLNHYYYPSFELYYILDNLLRSDNVVQVSIETKDFEKYIIAENQTGRQLFDYIDDMVAVRGYIVGEYFDGSEIFFLESYEIL